MEHFHLDEFAKKDSLLHRLDPRAKVIVTITAIFLTAGINSPLLLFGAAMFWFISLLISKVPIKYIFTRITWVFPFAGIMILIFPFIKPGHVIWQTDIWFFSLTATREGLIQALVLFLRVLASIMAVLFLTSTTRFNYLLKGLAQLKVPVVMLQLIEFTVRYIFVAQDELKRMRRARKARAFKTGTNLWDLHTLRTLGQLVGTMFIRAYERGERVYLAMMSRGYKGTMRTISEFKITIKDIVWSVVVLMMGIILVILDR